MKSDLKNLNFVILDRIKHQWIWIYQALMNNTSSIVSWTDLHGFNTKLELLFLEVLNSSWIYPIISKVRFFKRLANLHNIYL